MSNMVNYRADIDGLRAIAVVSVVLYHFGVIGFSGGFVGVDIFFAISGYLIGSIVFKQLDKQQFSFSAFYIRRIRRLFPAYLLTIIVSTALSYWLLLPSEFREFGQSIVAATLYTSNILFYMETGYFDAASHLKPLLHTWSLAVEEQFYLFFPLLAWLGFKYLRSRIVILFSILCVLSIISAVLFIDYDQSAVFYLYPFRAWEMFIGVLFAATTPKPLKTATAANLVATLGLSMLVLPISLYTQQTTFPGIAALPPCLGVLLIIYAGNAHQGWVNRLLSTSPFVFMGKISYSLYLWHWPLFVLYSYTLVDALSTNETLLLLATTFIVSIVSWRLVETPFRSQNSGWNKSKTSTFITTAIASSACIFVGLALHVSNGMPSRLSPQVAHLAKLADGFNSDWSNCVTEHNAMLPGLEHCFVGKPYEASNVVLVWGDSHAPALKNGFSQSANNHNQDALIVWQGGCPPVFGIEKDESAASKIDDERCASQNNTVLEWLNSNQQIKSVVLLARWSYYLNGGGIGIDAHNKVSIHPTVASATTQTQQEIFLSALNQTIATLSQLGLKVFIQEQLPEFPNYHSRAIARALKNGSVNYAEIIAAITREKYSDVLQRQQAMQGFLSTLTDKYPDIEILRSHHFFCDSIECSLLINDLPVYYDNNHISNTTSNIIHSMFTPVMTYMDQVEK